MPILDSINILRETSTEAFHRQFEKAAHRLDGEQKSYYKIAGQNLLLKSAGSKLKPFLFSALAHAVTDPFKVPAFTISVWEGQSSQIYPPELMLENNAYLKGEHIIGLRTTNYFCFVDFAEKEAFVYIDHLEAIPLHEIAAPLKTVFHWWLRSMGQQIVHAAAIGQTSGGLLITGKSGSGKSTAALSCLSSRLHYNGG